MAAQDQSMPMQLEDLFDALDKIRKSVDVDQPSDAIYNVISPRAFVRCDEETYRKRLTDGYQAIMDELAQ